MVPLGNARVLILISSPSVGGATLAVVAAVVDAVVDVAVAVAVAAAAAVVVGGKGRASPGRYRVTWSRGGQARSCHYY